MLIKSLKSILFVLFIFAWTSTTIAQETANRITYIDSTKTDTNTSVVIKRKHSPKIAWISSAILPGAGQVYNGKYWKVPLIYGGFAAGYYLNRFYNSHYKTYKYEYEKYRVSEKDTTFYIDGYKLSPAGVKEIRDYYRRNRDITTIALSVWYLLNIIDASVDAYMFDYDISDNLALHISPSTQYSIDGRLCGSMAIRIKFRH